MTSVIDPAAKIGEGCQIGHFCVIEADAEVGAGVSIGNRVTICRGTKIGNNGRVGDNVILGKRPNPARSSTVRQDRELAPLQIGENANIGANVIIYHGTCLGANVTVADLASLREECTVGDNVVIGRGVAVENAVKIGSGTKIQTGAYLTAGVILEEQVFIAPQVTTTNDNYMGRTERRFLEKKGAHICRGARVGGGSILLPGVKVGEEAFVAAGALVTKDVPAMTLVKGLPAREVRPVPPEELLDQQGR